MNSHSSLSFKSDILVVDDNRESLRLLSTMLSDSGYKVRKAINGTIALRAVEIAKPDLIILDINMPDMKGYEVCKQLKSKQQTSDIPVIFISALDDVIDKVQAFEVGGVDYITKPLELQEVLARVKTQLTISLQRKQLIEQQNQLAEQNARLQLLLTTTQAINEASDFHAALEVTLCQVCEKIGWDFGEFWLPNSQSTVFELGEGWYPRNQRFEEFRRESKKLAFATNRDFLRQVGLAKQPCWLTDVSVEPCDVFQRNLFARKVGLKTCLGVPILSKDQVLAVLVFLKKEASQPEPQVIELVNSLAAQLSSFIQHKRSESALRESQQQLAAMAANIPGCVYRGVVHPDGKMKLLYISEGEHELSGLNPQEAMNQPERLVEAIPANSQADFYKALRASAESQQLITQEYPIASPNGEVKWVRNSARYSLMDNGDVMVDGVAIDISDCLRHSFASRVAAEERLRILEGAIAASGSNISTGDST
jgi:DNA-binding response OmpR family regulator